jgi:hypothetical protein
MQHHGHIGWHSLVPDVVNLFSHCLGMLHSNFAGAIKLCESPGRAGSLPLLIITHSIREVQSTTNVEIIRKSRNFLTYTKCIFLKLYSWR